METLQAMAAIAQIVVAVIALVVSAVITWMVYKSTRRLTELQYWRTIGNVWMEIDKFALSDDQNLTMVDQLFHPDLAEESLEDRRKRWFGYIVLNAFSDAFRGVQAPPEIGPETGHQDRVWQELKPLMRNDVIYRLSQSGIYSPEFTNVCAELREESTQATTERRAEP